MPVLLPGFYLSHILDGITGAAIFRKERLAGIAFVMLFAGVKGLTGNYPLVETTIDIVIYGILVILLLRCRLLAGIVSALGTRLI